MNILFIMYDQLRFDYLSCAGHPVLKTPNFDRVAAMGVRFTQAHVQSPVCGSSRMSFYTGRYASSHGAQWNGYPLRVGEMTMGDLASEVSLSQATVTTILDRLEKRELIERKRGETDKRRVYACLTQGGLAIIDQAPTPLQDEFIARFDRLEDWEQSLILSSLQRVAAMMNAEDIDASPVLDLGAIDRAQPTLELSARTAGTEATTHSKADHK